MRVFEISKADYRKILERLENLERKHKAFSTYRSEEFLEECYDKFVAIAFYENEGDANG